MVAAALVDRPSFEQPHDRHERRVEDRHREHEDRQQERRDGRPGHLPARRQPERGEREPEHLRAGVAHEDERLAVRPQVERQEADSRRARRRATRTSTASLGWTVTASIAKKPNAIAASVAASPSMLSSRLNAFVIPTSQSSATSVGDDLRCGRAGRRCRSRARSPAARELRRELRERRQRAEVVDQPGERRAGRCRRRSRRAARSSGIAPDGDREPEPGGEPDEDPDAAEERRGALVPAVGRGRCDEAPRERRAEQQVRPSSAASGEGDEPPRGCSRDARVVERC